MERPVTLARQEDMSKKWKHELGVDAESPPLRFRHDVIKPVDEVFYSCRCMSHSMSGSDGSLPV